MPKIILSAPTCDFPIVDGMDRTVMITAETACATAFMLPVRNILILDVAYRALLGATTTVNTYVAVNGELLVTNHETVKVGTDDMAEYPWGRS